MGSFHLHAPSMIQTIWWGAGGGGGCTTLIASPSPHGKLGCEGPPCGRCGVAPRNLGLWAKSPSPHPQPTEDVPRVVYARVPLFEGEGGTPTLFKVLCDPSCVGGRADCMLRNVCRWLNGR